MKLIKYVIEHDGELLINEFVKSKLLINKEYAATSFPLCIEWFEGNDLILEPGDFQKIQITDEVFILRKEIPKKGKTDMVPFLFLESVRRGDFERARKYLGFDISDENLKNYFGEFEILANNYLGREDVFSILPKNSTTAKNFVFEIVDDKIANIKNCP
jgi:hypothetical protein